MKKITHLILIGLLIVSPQSIHAQELTPADRACTTEKPDYSGTFQQWDTFEDKRFESYQGFFNVSQEKYHLYIECLFEYARSTILNYTHRRQGTFSAMTPNTPNIPWMNPYKACLESNQLKSVIDATKPDHLLTPALEAYDQYYNHLWAMHQAFEDDFSGEITSSDLTTIEFLNDAELESALMVLDLAFNDFNDLRTNFVIHVQTQCLLNHLEKYRRALGEIRRVVDALPGRLQNASITK